MKKFKSLLSIVLVIALIASFVMPITAFAAGETVALPITKVADGVYKLTYTATATEKVFEAGLVLSFDNTIISLAANVTNYPIAVVTDGQNQDSNDYLAASMTNPVMNALGTKALYTSAIAAYVNGNRTAVNCALSAAQGSGVVPSGTVMFELYFRLINDATESSLNKTSFKVETATGAGTFLNRATQNHGVFFKTFTSSVTEYGYNGTNPIATTLSYTGDDVDTLVSTEIVNNTGNIYTLTVPGAGVLNGKSTTKYNLSVDKTGLDGAYTGAAPTTTWSITAPATHTGVAINATTGELSVDTTATDVTVTVQASSVVNLSDTPVISTKQFAIQRAPAALTFVGLTSYSVCANGSEQVSIAATAYTQYNDEITSGVSWSLVDSLGATKTYTGVSFDATTNQIKIDAKAAADTVYVKGSHDTGAARKSFTISRNPSVATTVEVGGGNDTIAVPTVAENNGTADTAAFTATVKDQYDSTMTGQNVTWSITQATGVSISSGGVVTVTKDAAATAEGTPLVVTATCGETTGTKNLAITKANPVATSVVVEGGQESILVPGNGIDGNTSTAFTATVKDQYGATMTGQTIEWTVKDGSSDVTGVTISNGVVTVTNAAKGTIEDTTGKRLTVTATVGAARDTDTIIVKRADPVATTIEIGDGPGAMDIPADGVEDNVQTYPVTVKDQYGAAIALANWPAMTYTIEKNDGQSFKAYDNGTLTAAAGTGANAGNVVVTVTNRAKEFVATSGAFLVKVASGAVVETKEFNVQRAEQAATTVKIFKGATEIPTSDTIVIPTSSTPSHTTYTAKLFDQYGAEITGRSFDIEPDSQVPSNTSALHGIVTVEGSPNNNTGSFTLKAFDTGSGKEKSITINITKLNPSWSEISANTSPVYGDTNGDIINGEDATAMTYNLGDIGTYDKTLTGTYAVTNAATVQHAGENKEVTVVFTADNSEGNGDYKGLTLSKIFTVDIAHKPVTVNVTAAEKIYGAAALSGFEATLADGFELVGDDTIAGLDLSLTSTGNNKSADAGQYDVTGYDNNTNYDVTINGGTKALTVKPAKLTVTNGTVAVTKVYDGKTDAGTLSGDLSFTPLNSDTVTVTPSAPIAYDSKNVGAAYSVDFTMTLGGTDAGNYTLGEVTAARATTATGTIDNAAITAKDITAVTNGTYALTKVYDGKTDAGTATGALALTGMIAGDDLGITTTQGAYDNAAVGTAKTVTLTLGDLTGEDAGNYTKVAALTSYSFTAAAITPADYTYTVAGTQNIKVGSGLSAITVAPATGTGVNSETPVVAVTWYSNSSRTTEAIEDNISAKPTGATVTLYWSAVPEVTPTNYTTTPKTGSTVFTIVEGDPQVFAAGFTTAVTKTYGGDAFTNAASLTTGTGAISYASSDETVATVDASTGEVTILKAGETTITATAAYVPGEWAETEASYVLTVSPKTVTISWPEQSYIYTKEAKGPTATVNGLVGEDTCTATVKYTGNAFLADENSTTASGASYNSTTAPTNAGNYSGAVTTADLSNANYKVDGNSTKPFTIAKADRGISWAVSGGMPTIDLYGDTLTGSVPELTFVDLDSSAVVTYISDNTAKVTVNNAGKLTAVANATGVYIKASIAQTVNYQAEEKSVATVRAVVNPITDIGVNKSGIVYYQDNAARTLKLYGYMTAGDDLEINLTTVGLGGGTPSNETASIEDVNAEKLAAGTSVDIPLVEGITVTYTIDTSVVVLLPADVVLAETKPEATNKTGQTAVATALTNANNETKMLDAAAAAAVVAEAKSKTLPTDATKIKATVNLKIEATGYDTTSTPKTFTLELTPQVTYQAVNNQNRPIDVPVTEELPNSALKSPVWITIALPAGLVTGTGDKLIVKHIMDGGAVEYLPVEITENSGIYYATWYQLSFSEVELYVDSRTGTIEYHFNDGAVQRIDYDAADLDTKLPVDEKSGNTFNGWDIDAPQPTPAAGADSIEKATSLTTEVLNSIDGTRRASANNKYATAIPVFAPVSGGSTGAPSATTYTIKASAGENGKINPVGEVKVDAGAEKTFAITANEGYEIKEILVDGKAVTTTATYTFKDVKADHTISVSFKAKGAETDKFKDVTGHWAFDAIEYNLEKGYMKGMSDTTFEPETEMNRAMVVTMLYRIAGEPAVTEKATFSDVAAGEWYTDPIIWAAKNKIVEGKSTDKFDPYANITRQELAVILYRYAKFAGKDVSAAKELTAFTDADEIASWAVTEMKWAVDAGLINGRTKTTIVPNGTAKRCEVATIIMRYFG